MDPRLRRPLNYTWLEAALEAWLETERTNTRRAEAKLMAREIVAICAANREKATLAEEFYVKYRDHLSRADRQGVLRLIAETLLYIQYDGVRMKVSSDPMRILGG